MVSTVFSDYIVNATELRKNQKQWLDKAFINPITVNYGKKQLAILNREKVGKLYASQFYSELVLKACQEFERKNTSTIFPWVEHLSDIDKMRFHTELLSTTIKAMVTGRWNNLENLIGDWEATAMVERTPVVAEALREEEDSSQYVEVEE